MCLQTTWTEPKIAKEDLIVYKLLKKIDDSDFFHPEYDYRAAFMTDFLYKSNKLYETKIYATLDNTAFDTLAMNARNEHTGSRLNSIGKGFHSAWNIERLTDLSEDEVIVKCIIPKGAEFYIGLTDLLVSNQIIIKEIVKWG